MFVNCLSPFFYCYSPATSPPPPPLRPLLLRTVWVEDKHYWPPSLLSSFSRALHWHLEWKEKPVWFGDGGSEVVTKKAVNNLPEKKKVIKKIVFFLKKVIKNETITVQLKEVLEGSLELCRLEALWHRAKAPNLTPRPRESKEGQKDGMTQSWAERHAEPHGDAEIQEW